MNNEVHVHVNIENLEKLKSLCKRLEKESAQVMKTINETNELPLKVVVESSESSLEISDDKMMIKANNIIINGKQQRHRDGKS